MTFTGIHRSPAVRTGSPRIPDHVLARYPAATAQPAPHTTDELLRLLSMLHDVGVGTVAIGHGRQEASIAAAGALTHACSNADWIVVTGVAWPATAASWLRPARRLASVEADAIVIADTPAGCAQLTARLAEQPNWTPARTFGFASVASPDLISLAKPGTLIGMTGPTSTGGIWRVGHGVLIRDDAPALTAGR